MRPRACSAARAARPRQSHRDLLGLSVRDALASLHVVRVVGILRGVLEQDLASVVDLVTAAGAALRHAGQLVVAQAPVLERTSSGLGPGRLLREGLSLAVTGFWYMISMMDMQHVCFLP
jgi:hypothetical protein